MRSKTSLFALLLVAGSLALPLVAQAGGIPFFGPIIDKAWMQCPLGWGALITVINNIISFLITIAIVFVAPLMIAWAGFLMVFSPTKVGDVSKARLILLNTVIGIVIALAGWLIVDAIMAVLYNANAKTNNNGGVLGTWSALIGSGGLPPCIDLKGSVKSAVAPPPGVGITPRIGRAPGPCSDSNTACSINAIQQGAQALNMNLTNVQAAAMSCIAVTESRGNPGTSDSNTGACGTFQITNRPGNWSIPAFHRSPCSIASSCNDAQCNLQTALLMIGQRGYQPWTGRKPDGTYWNPNAVACVQQYDSNTTLRI